MAYQVTRSTEEIDELRNKIMQAIDGGTSRFGGMSYEQGIDETLRWLFGETEDHPYEEEPEGG